MHIIIKLLPWVLILYGFWGGYEVYETKTVENQALSGEISGLDVKLVKLQKTKKEIEVYYSDIETAKDKFKKISKEFELVQKKLPEKLDNKENFNLFKDIAKRMLIKEINFSIGKNRKKEGYVEKSYTVNGKGTYLQFLLFFEALYKYEQLFDVKNILFRTVDVQEKGRFQVVEGQFDINTYLYRGIERKNETE